MEKDDLKEELYGAESIKVLKGLEAVKKRPGMYIGNTDDGSGLHHMVFEVLDNSIDEVLAGHCSKITITIMEDESVAIEDDGRGIPVDMHEEEGVSAAELIMTQLHAGGKFDQNSYKVSGGLHGVGVSVVNALSSKLILRVKRNNKLYEMIFKDGAIESQLQVIEENIEGTGTFVQFYPSPETFTQTIFDRKVLEARIRELAFLNSGIHITLIDKRSDKLYEQTFCYKGGLLEFVKHLAKGKLIINETPILCKIQEGNVSVEMALFWTNSYHESTICFTNNIPQKEGGTHLMGLRNALTRCVGAYLAENAPAKGKKDLDITGEDIREGIVCILSVKVPEPKFSSQTKDKLVSSEVRPAVEAAVSEAVKTWFEEHPQQTKPIFSKILEAASAREAARKARELTRTKKVGFILNGKLAHCQEKDPEKCEIFIVEGDSAGGSAKQARDRKFQAILPMRGKIMNVERSRFDKILSSPIIGPLIAALGAGIGDGDFDLSKLKYHKVVIMTDADVDGSHIRTLLLTLFYRYMRDVIEKGYLYVAQPPLFRVRKGQRDMYLKNEKDLNQYLIAQVVEDLEITDGANVLSGEPLNAFLQKLFQLREYAMRVSLKIQDIDLVEWLFRNNGFAKEIDIERLKAALTPLQKEYSIHERFLEYSIQRKRYGTAEEFFINTELINSFDVRVLQKIWNELTYFDFDNTLIKYKKEDPKKIDSIIKLVELIDQIGRKGITINRYKGLGEMDADQLWETTLNPANRTLLQVKMENLEITEEIVSMLMGDVVEPRRNFIQENALYSNIDT